MKRIRLSLLVLLILEEFHRGHNFFFSVPRGSKDLHDGYNDGEFVYKSRRKQTLNCSCGMLYSGKESSKNSTQFPWNVRITSVESSPVASTFSKNNTHAFGKRRHHDEQQHCGGTIINDRVVLTSVKCVLKMTTAELFDEMPKPLLFPEECIHSPKNLQVWIPAEAQAAEESSVREKMYNVSHFYYHPKYLSSMTYYEKQDYDIALLTLKERISFHDGATLPVCLPTESFKEEQLIGHQAEILIASSNESNSLTSFIYPRMRCRVNSLKKWISDRFLCTQAPSFENIKNVTVGSASTIRGENDVITQYGIHSWSNYFPLVFSRIPLSLSTNVAGFLEKIEDYSEKMGARWCAEPENKLPYAKSNQYNPSSINERVNLENDENWMDVTSDTREVRKSCKCGVVNSLAFSSNGRIQGGMDAVPYEYGWLVQLISRNGKTKQLCGGSLINDRIVLTAAHCVFKLNNNAHRNLWDEVIRPENLEVRVSRYKGPNADDQNSFLALVEAVIPHPHYTDSLAENDIALIVLSKALDFKRLKGKVSPICFPETNENLTDTEDRDDAKVIGWGRTNATEKGSHAKNLQELQVKTIPLSACQAILRKYNTFIFNMMLSDNNRICAGNFRPVKDYKDPAKGDSGGPLFLPLKKGGKTMIQIGIASLVTVGSVIEMGLKDDVETATLYTRVLSYVNFVDYYSLIAGASWCSR